MASFSVNLPWQTMVAAMVPAYEAEIARDLPGVSARIDVGDAVVVVTVATDGGPGPVAYAVAVHLAPLWRELLDGVDLRVECGGLVWLADSTTMAALAAGGLGQVPWLAAASG